jgi:hypothetical protein
LPWPETKQFFQDSTALRHGSGFPEVLMDCRALVCLHMSILYYVVKNMWYLMYNTAAAHSSFGSSGLKAYLGKTDQGTPHTHRYTINNSTCMSTKAGLPTLHVRADLVVCWSKGDILHQHLGSECPPQWPAALRPVLPVSTYKGLHTLNPPD